MLNASAGAEAAAKEPAAKMIIALYLVISVIAASEQSLRK
jgi:hypothetical protein